MGWTVVLRAAEMESFRRCRRAWDFGARIRQNYVPVVPPQVFDFDRAVHDALAVYYFPAMDDWDRAIVRPLALQAFERRMHEQRSNYEKLRPLEAEQQRQFGEHVALGKRMLQHFFAWAAELDDFASIFADHEFWAPIPDADNPGHELVSPNGWPIRYLGRIDQLISNRDDEYWVVEHRLANEWADTDQLRRPACRVLRVGDAPLLSAAEDCRQRL